jgi:hypothetical protein
LCAYLSDVGGSVVEVLGPRLAVEQHTPTHHACTNRDKGKQEKRVRWVEREEGWREKMGKDADSACEASEMEREYPRVEMEKKDIGK